ncbi:MAG: 3-dehydroquinate dehydratase [Erysipelotrichaceae bacterium]|nr:3-dehydroquinate dehydratase [Erysipelotrichaceae bacterium]
MKLLVLNGPNLNFIGIREPEIYGKETYNDLCDYIKKYAEANNIEIEIKQSNHEGYLVDFIHQAYFDKVDGIIINPGAYTHTSIALLDAIKSVNIKTIEVHLSDVTKREDFRQVSYLRSACVKSIMGKGFLGYTEAIDYFLNK